MVTIASRFNGPPRSGNGGYTCGLLAERANARVGGGPVRSTLRLPPPLDTPLSWEDVGDVTRLLTAGGAEVGEARPGHFERDAPTPPHDAEAAARAYQGHHDHPFGTCFTCGPDRADSDGLRIFTGPVSPPPDKATVAAPWTPSSGVAVDGDVPLPVVWAAIDCAGGWAADFTVHPTVLGRMTAEVLRTPEVGEPCTVVGRLDAHEGRKFLTSTALHRGDELLARSEQVWIEVDPTTF